MSKYKTQILLIVISIIIYGFVSPMSADSNFYENLGIFLAPLLMSSIAGFIIGMLGILFSRQRSLSTFLMYFAVTFFTLAVVVLIGSSVK